MANLRAAAFSNTRARSARPPLKSDTGIGFLAFLGAISVGMAALMLNVAMTKPGRAQATPDEPEVVVIDGHLGVGSMVVNGEYRLMPRPENGRPIWAKYADTGRLPGSYLLCSSCGEWIVTTHRSARGSKCDGLVVARGCVEEGPNFGPWNCTGHWRSVAKSGKLSDTMAVTPAQGPSALTSCSAEEEQEAQEELSNVDLVLTWVNGSDPAWLSDRAAACEDFMWNRWPEALASSPSAKGCLQESAAVGEAREFVQSGACSAGAWGQEGACADKAEVERGLTTRASLCFQRFVKEQCSKREQSIADHDELRYLVRSIERNLPWHTGRILLVIPRAQYPGWLHARGRVRVIAQEDLFSVAARAPEFVAAAKRGEHSYLPDRIFNDDPVVLALPFLPQISRLALVLQDDLLFPRPVSACELFVRPPGAGMRLYGKPSKPQPPEDAWAAVYRAHISHTAGFWHEQLASEQLVAAARGDAAEGPSAFYEPQHVPDVVDTQLLRELWRKWPKDFSSSMDSAFRHPRLLNPIALHNSEAVRRGRVARSRSEWRTSWVETIRRKVSSTLAVWRRKAEARYMSVQPAMRKAKEFDSTQLAARTRIVDIQDPGQTLVKEVVMHQGTAPEWRSLMEDIVGGRVVPAVLSIQDDLDGPAADEYVCLREQWLNRLLQGPSTWEDPRQPPSLCRLQSPPPLGPDR